jgi:hypothetical protein
MFDHIGINVHDVSAAKTPGIRKEYHRSYYGAFITDLDGHNVECVCHWPPLLLWMVSWPAIVGYIGAQLG